MPRPKGSKNIKTIMQEYKDNPNLDVFNGNFRPLPEDKNSVERYGDKLPELKDIALSLVKNPDGTRSVIKIPFDNKTKTYGTPEVIETGDYTEVFYRFRVLAGDTWE